MMNYNNMTTETTNKSTLLENNRAFAGNGKLTTSMKLKNQIQGAAY